MQKEQIDPLELVHVFWPEITVPKNPYQNAEFIVQVYHKFVKYVTERIGELLNEEPPPDEFDNIRDFDQTVIVFLKATKLLRKLDQQTFHLIDLYMPNLKKMKPLLMVPVHFVLYIDSFFNEILAVISEILKKIEKSELQVIQKREFVSECASKAESIAHKMNMAADLKTQLKQVTILYEQMLQEEKQADAVRAAKIKKIEELERVVELLEIQKKSLDETAAELKEQIVDEREYEQLMIEAASLQKELEEFDTSSETEYLKKNLEDVQQLEKYSEQLSQIDTDHLHSVLTQRHEIEVEHKSVIDTLKDLGEELKTHNSALELRQKQVDQLQAVANKKEEKVRTYSMEITNEQRNEEKKLQFEIEKSAAGFEERQRLLTQIGMTEEQIKMTEKNFLKVNEIAEANYQKLLNADKKVTNKVHDLLSRIINEMNFE